MGVLCPRASHRDRIFIAYILSIFLFHKIFYKSIHPRLNTNKPAKYNINN